MSAYFTALIELGNHLSEQGRHEDASEMFRQAVHEKAGSAEPRYLLGKELLACKRHEESEIQLKRAIHFDCKHLPARLALAELYMQRKDYPAAIALLQGTFPYNNESIELHQLLIDACIKGGEFDDAERIARRWGVIAPADARAFLAYAHIQFARPVEVRDWKSIKDALDSALSVDPGCEDAAQLLGQCIAHLDGPDKALKTIAEFAEKHPGGVRPLLATAQILDSVGQQVHATRVLEGILEQMENEPLRTFLQERRTNRTDRVDERLVVFVTDQIRSRQTKMAMALKQIGWQTVVITRTLPDFDITPYFAEVKLYRNREHGMHLATGYRPKAYHVFSTWGDDLALQLIKERPGKVIFEPYDLLEGFNERPGFEEHVRKQRDCMEKADAISCRDLRTWYVRKYLDYKLPEKTLYFPDYCWNRPATVNKKADGLHIVSNGYVGTGRSGNDADWGVLDIAIKFMQLGCHFHMYPHPTQATNGQFNDDLLQFVALQQQVPLFHLHLPVGADRVVSEYENYHVGISFFGSGALDKPLQGYTPAHLAYCSASRNVDYIDAGIPVLITPELKFQTRQLRKYGLAIPVGKHGWDKMSETLLKAAFDPGLPERAQKAKQLLSISRHVNRLAAFYQGV